MLERCSCILQIVDARNPLFYLSSDLRSYATTELGKPMLLILNKSDFLSPAQRQAWHEYFVAQGWDHLFFSAHIEQEKLDQAATEERQQARIKNPLEHLPEVKDLDENDTEPVDSNEASSLAPPTEASSTSEAATEAEATTTTESSQTPKLSTKPIGIQTPLTRQELLDWLHDFAVKYKCEKDERYQNRIQFGMVGFPNVGKSSVINVLVGSSKHAHGVVRVAVAAQPGKTKHFQTLLLPDRDDMMLCDCPGLVFPSFVSSTADLIAAGVYPIAQMRDHWPVIELICQRIPREILNAQYGIHLPIHTDPRQPDLVPKPPTAEELLETYCVARSMLSAASGVPDFQRASRLVIKDYADGKLLYCHAPPTNKNVAAFHHETIATALTRTRKLREKLNAALEQQQQQHNVGRERDGSADDLAIETEPDNGFALGGADLDDLDILDAIEGVSAPSSNQGGKRGKKHKSMQKRGKKGRKDRNKDPYGCHSTPDDDLGTALGGAGGGGIVVNAGKYGRRDYTRPTSYGGAKSLSQFSGK